MSCNEPCPQRLRQKIQALLRKAEKIKREEKIMSNTISIQGVTRGITQATALRERYEKEGFGLETGFERRDWAKERVADLRQEYNLVDADIRLVRHISSSESGKKTAWEVYVRDGKGVKVLFL